MKRIVVAMAAHVDAGKTTLTEELLYTAGAIRKRGRVDNCDAFLDNDPIERKRGITIFSKQAILKTENAEFTLLDTPGHVDFSAEAERALSVPDCAVLVISGTDGIQSHTRTLWELLRRFEIPVFIFVNKMDISHRSRDEIISELHELSPSVLALDESFEENSAEYDEDCMNSLLESAEVSTELAAKAIGQRRIFPVLFGSALRSDGADRLLDALERYTLPRERCEKFAAVAYKITTDENGVRLTHLKINGGELKNRSVIDNSDEKITQIRIYNGTKYTAADTAFEGQLCAVAGLTKTHAGQTFGAQPPEASPFIESYLNYKVDLPEGTDVFQTFIKLKRLEEEDPQLKFSWNEQLKEIHISVMGEIQLEVLQNLIEKRFDEKVTFSEGSIAYRETIEEKVVGMGHFEPLRHYAEVHLLIEPQPPGSGVTYAVDSNSCAYLDENWQRLIISNLRERRHIGVLTGSPITDVKITLIAGRAHQKHTEGGDFRQAAWRAVRQGLRSAKSVLLEPYCEFRLSVPTSSVGRAMTDLQQMGAKFSQTDQTDGEFSVLEGSCPVSEMRGYSREVIGYTHGTGTLSTTPKGYFPCHNSDEVIERIGYRFENDVENTADSVFCSHGAGYLVKWDEAPAKMHVKTETAPREHVSEAEISTYKQRIATDKELMEIFERTYGKIKRPERASMRRDAKFEKIPKLPPPKKGPEYLLVDGYNIIFSWEELSALAKTDLDSARAWLINIMCNYQGFKNCNLILVFDAYKVKSDREVEKYGNVIVIYTKEAETADMFIEKAAMKLSSESRVRVATSDGTEQLIIFGAGAVRVSAREFKMEVDEVEQSIRKILEDLH